jgi:hypothetical protein
MHGSDLIPVGSDPIVKSLKPLAYWGAMTTQDPVKPEETMKTRPHESIARAAVVHVKADLGLILA